MSDKLIITIGRECGSGGRHIGQKLAEEMGVKCYDKELLPWRRKRADSAENCLRHMMKNPPAAFYIPL